MPLVRGYISNISLVEPFDYKMAVTVGTGSKTTKTSKDLKNLKRPKKPQRT